jgi:phosphohistidine phosphatase SixA
MIDLPMDILNQILRVMLCSAPLVFVASSAKADATSGVSASDIALWAALRDGGKVAIIRHAQVETGADSGDPLVRDASCNKEKNLSDQGRRNAELVGRVFREHGIPIARVMHSPYCRTTETARIAFSEASPAQLLSLLEVLSAAEAAQQTERLNRLIESHRGKGNLVLVTHEPNINAVSFELMRHLDILVLDPAGTAEFEELGVIRFGGVE